MLTALELTTAAEYLSEEIVFFPYIIFYISYLPWLMILWVRADVQIQYTSIFLGFLYFPVTNLIAFVWVFFYLLFNILF